MSQLALNWVNPHPIKVIAQGKNAHRQPLSVESFALKFGFHDAGGPASGRGADRAGAARRSQRRSWLR